RHPLGLYGLRRLGALKAKQARLVRVQITHHERAEVCVVEGLQPLQHRADGLTHAEAWIRELCNLLEQAQPALQPQLTTAPISHHVAEHEQIDGTQQETVQLEIRPARSRRVADDGEEQGRRERHAEPGPKAPTERSDQNGKEEKEKEDAARAATERDEDQEASDVHPV